MKAPHLFHHAAALLGGFRQARTTPRPACVGALRINGACVMPADSLFTYVPRIWYSNEM